ncbi:MAG: glycosyltransferase, partial [Nitrososphaera sp.]
SYLGTFYLGRSPKSFLDALSALIKERDLDKSELEVRFIGDVRYAEGESVEDMIKGYDLSSCVKISDSVPHKDALIAMKQSHVLLLFAPDQYYCIPAKAFEYIGSRRRILCFSKDGATADLVRQTDSGIVVDSDDIQQIKSAILRFYTQYKQGPANTFSHDIGKFTRRALTASFSQLLEESIELRRR